MSNPEKEESAREGEFEQMKQDIRDMKNDIARIKGNTLNISRIMNLANRQAIESDLITLIGTSEYKAAILELTEQDIGPQQLARDLGTNPKNLNKFLGPFVDKGYVTPTKHGKDVYYKRSEVVDLLGILSIEQVKTLIEAWRQSKQSKAVGQSAPTDSQSIIKVSSPPTTTSIPDSNAVKSTDDSESSE